MTMRRALLLALLLAFAATAAMTEERVEVIDGDTIRVEGVSVRLVGLDAPEMRGACPTERHLAARARDRLVVLLADGVIVESRGHDRFGRVLAVVREIGGRDVAQLLIAEGLARPYDGRGARPGWCG